VPDDLDWTLWQGPSRESSFMINTDRKNPHGLNLDYDWYCFRKYGNGEIGNQAYTKLTPLVGDTTGFCSKREYRKDFEVLSAPEPVF